MTKPIYYSNKMQKYYFNDTNVITGGYHAITVYNGVALVGGTVRTDKNGKNYILGEVIKVKGKNGYYWKCTGYTPDSVDPVIAEATVDESAF